MTKTKSRRVADIVAMATRVFGSEEEARLWLKKPSMGLNHRRPIDLLDTSSGTIMVEKHLLRLKYGVYT